jgi:hydrogenase maturation protease
VTLIPTTLVLGFGNASLTDDGIGVHAIEYLRPRFAAMPGVGLLDGGTSVFEVLEHFEHYERLIVVDAAELGGAPGLVQSFVDAEMDRQLGKARHTVHEVALCDLFDMARLRDVLPARRALVGVQPRSVGWGSEPSSELTSALPTICERVVNLVCAWPDASSA